jgi:glycine cleavage system transcriptional repressor
MNQYAVAAMGTDRPGIVAAMGEAILAAGGNIDDSSMTILGGHFAMLLIVEADCDEQALHRALEPVAGNYGLLLEVQQAERHPYSGRERDDYVVAAYGPDRPGLVSRLSRVLADADINITDFGSRIGADDTFAMWFNVSMPEAVDLDGVAEQLRSAGADLRLDVRVYRAEAEEL